MILYHFKNDIMKRKYHDYSCDNNDLHDYFINQTIKNLNNLISTHLIDIKIKDEN